ncbi:hypothetical protein ACHAQH_001585 [Verticillium albo-atrum]
MGTISFMDPVSAAGFASSLITFIDFSCKVIQGSIDLYKSTTGATTDNARISNIVEDLQKITETIANPCPPDQNAKHWPELIQLAVDCNGSSKELAAILDNLKVKEGNKVWRSVEAGWKNMCKSNEVVSLEQNLNIYRIQILLRLSIILNDNQTSVKSQLEELQKGNAKHFAQTVTQLGDIQQAIENLDKRIMREAGLSPGAPPGADDSYNALDDLRSELSSAIESLQAIAARTPADLHVLNRLYFESIHTREDNVKDAEFGTFSWLLHDENCTRPFDDREDDSSEDDGESEDDDGSEEVDQSEDDDGDRETSDFMVPGNGMKFSNDNRDSDSVGKKKVDVRVDIGLSDVNVHMECLNARRSSRQRFRRWLRSDNGVFHISGRAGSGKSTLMKLICQDQTLRDMLDIWAGTKKLIFAHFFFWRSGTDLQRSLEGLYRSLLFNFWSLANEPHVERMAWAQSPFRLPELRKAMGNLIASRSGLNSHRFCFLIDGLDEFEGDSTDHWDLAQQLRLWTDSPNVKLCVSSRPHQQFLSVFAEEKRINLPETTRNDIRRFVEGSLDKHGVYHLSRILTRALASRICERANGVFLWAWLVVRSLVDGVQYRLSFEALSDMIEP